MDFVCIIMFCKSILLLFGVTGWFEWMSLQQTSTMVGSLYIMGPPGHMCRPRTRHAQGHHS